MKILIVDDEKMLRRLLSEDLSRYGYEVLEADNGESGFEKFTDHQPQLVISDLMMPLMDGYGLYKKINELQKDFPYILITGYPDELSRFDIKTDGHFVVMQKPFREADLLKVISQVLGDRSLPTG